MPALSVYGSDVFVHCEAATWDHRLEQWRFKQGKSVFCAELDHYYGIAQKLGAPTRDVDLVIFDIYLFCLFIISTHAHTHKQNEIELETIGDQRWL